MLGSSLFIKCVIVPSFTTLKFTFNRYRNQWNRDESSCSTFINLAHHCCYSINNCKSPSNRGKLNSLQVNMFSTRKRRQTADSFCELVVNNATVDFDSEVTKDIRESVFELLERAVVKLTERGLFKVSRIQPCGSMAEKTSLWKTHRLWKLTADMEAHPKYLEFDFLAVLEKARNYTPCEQELIGLSNLKSFIKKIEKASDDRRCSGCMDVDYSPIDESLFSKNSYTEEDVLKWKQSASMKDLSRVNELFSRELFSSIASLCNCLSVKTYDNWCSYLFQPTKETRKNCNKCCVFKNTGYLEVDTSVAIRGKYILTRPENCSIVFLWNCSKSPLQAPNDKTLQKTIQITRLPIYIDFLPAFEVLDPEICCNSQGAKQSAAHPLFIVPKHCSAGCLGSWRVSNCLAEIDMFTIHISTSHKRCFLVLKYMNEKFLFGSSYHLKTSVLNHTKSCSEQSRDIRKCIFTILEDLLLGYKSGDLRGFDRNVNLIESIDKQSLSEKKLVAYKMMEFLIKVEREDSSLSVEESSEMLDELAKSANGR